MESGKIIQVEDRVPFRMLLPLSIQHMFAMFGASVLVPFMFGISPAIVLFMNGMGTLLFIAVTKGKAPAYLGSSFAFLAPAGLVIDQMGYSYALGGFVAVGFCGCILSFIIFKFGCDWIDVVLPPAAMGPVVALIGLELSGSAAGNAGLLDKTIDTANVIVFGVTLGVAVFGSILFRKFLAVIPILIAVVAGYAAAVACGLVDFTAVSEAPLFALPHFMLPKFSVEAMITILPVLLVITSEHIGHQVVTSKIVGRDLLRDPGLHRSLLGDKSVYHDLRSDRFGAHYDLRREYRGHGRYKSVQCACDCRSCRSVGDLFFCGKTFHADPDDSRPCDRRNFFSPLRHDRGIGYPNPGGFQGRLRTFQEPDSDQRGFCNRFIRHCRKNR